MNNDKGNMKALDDLIQHLITEAWFSYAEGHPDQAEVVRELLDNKIARMTFTEEGDPPRLIARVVFNDSKMRPLELFAIDPPRVVPQSVH